jgi:hypothetical protein
VVLEVAGAGAGRGRFRTRAALRAALAPARRDGPFAAAAPTGARGRRLPLLRTGRR